MEYGRYVGNFWCRISCIFCRIGKVVKYVMKERLVYDVILVMNDDKEFKV